MTKTIIKLSVGIFLATTGCAAAPRVAASAQHANTEQHEACRKLADEQGAETAWTTPSDGKCHLGDADGNELIQQRYATKYINHPSDVRPYDALVAQCEQAARELQCDIIDMPAHPERGINCILVDEGASYYAEFDCDGQSCVAHMW